MSQHYYKIEYKTQHIETMECSLLDLFLFAHLLVLDCTSFNGRYQDLRIQQVPLMFPHLTKCFIETLTCRTKTNLIKTLFTKMPKVNMFSSVTLG